jgi:hypothetical protein
MMQQVGAFSILWPLNWLRVILSDLVISHHAQAVFDVSTSNLLNDHGVIQPRILSRSPFDNNIIMIPVRMVQGARNFFIVCGDAAIENSIL